jgi:hypothetical protein
VHPNQSPQRALQVDIQRVIEAEAGMYTSMIADLTRKNAVLSTALDDVQAENGELRAKLQAATGMSFGGPVAPGGPFAASSARATVAAPDDSPADATAG